MKEAMTEQLFDQQTSSIMPSLCCDYLSSKINDREVATWKNEDDFQLKSTEDDIDSPQSEKNVNQIQISLKL